MIKIKNTIRGIYLFLDSFGFNPLKTGSFFKGIFFYFNDLRKLKSQKKNNSDFVFGILHPILNERAADAGSMSGHYFHQDLLVAKKIYKNNPVKHIDIGSRVDGFVAHLAVFREIELFDIRNLKSNTQNIVFKQANLINLPKEMLNYCDSVSSLHAIEHFGLGRYGDPIDYYGHIKAIENIYKILKNGGKFYFSVPIGRQRIEFNAHRVFDLKYLTKLFDNKFKINSFNYVDDSGNLFENVSFEENKIKNNFGCHYGCGIFEMTKI